MGDISKYFSKSELACKCCGQCKMNQAFLERLDALRWLYNKPMIVSSGYRCPHHNAKVSSTGGDGPHTTGRAVDILVSGQSAHAIIKLATHLGFTGIGVNQKSKHANRFIHLDDLKGPTRPWVWSY